MYARSSKSWVSFSAVGACALLGACASARSSGGTAQISAANMPELGEATPGAVAAALTEGTPARARLTMARLDLNTPVARLCADPRAKAVLDTDLPGLTARPEFPFFKSMSLNTLKKMSHGQMSDADLAKVQAELARLGEAPPAGADQ